MHYKHLIDIEKAREREIREAELEGLDHLISKAKIRQLNEKLQAAEDKVTFFESVFQPLNKLAEKITENEHEYIAQNYVMYFRCKPALGLQFNSKMVKQIIDVFTNNYERKHFTLTVPKAFDYLMDVEKVASSTIKPLRLVYKLHKMSQGVAAIFVNKSEDPACVKKAMTARSLFEGVFKFDQVTTYYDLSKGQIVQILNLLHMKAIDFEAAKVGFPKKEFDTLVIAIVNIGDIFTPETSPDHETNARFHNMQKIPNSIVDQSEYLPNYNITCRGEAIVMNEYACTIANEGIDTSVVLLDDCTPGLPNFISDIDDFKLNERNGRRRVTYINQKGCIAKLLNYFLK